MTEVLHYRVSRRYYLKGESRYVPLKELREWVRQGKAFRVIDYRTKTESTNTVLLKILSLSMSVPDHELKRLIQETA